MARYGDSEEMGELMVDALDDGRIVRVSERYARREGLPIVRHISTNSMKEERMATMRSAQRKETASFDLFRKPLRHQQNDVRASLIDNFHWELLKKRRERRLTRKQLAAAINSDEASLKLVENGVLPSEDFILISKLEQYYGINLRKEGTSFFGPQQSSASPPPPSASIQQDQKRRGGEAEASEAELNFLAVDDLLADRVRQRK